MFIFILANLPLPFLAFLNIHVTLKFLKVRRLSRNVQIDKPERLIVGWWLGNISTIFALAPALIERRLFVQNRWWLICYAFAASLSIIGLLLMNSGLSEELRELTRLRRKKRRPQARKSK